MIYPESISSKLPMVGTNIFTVMSALAQQENAINLSQGFPDFEVSPNLTKLVNKAMKKGLNQYAPMAGLLSLRERLAEKYGNLYSATYSPEKEITITAGGTQAIYTAITSLIKEGDEVILFNPAYDCYAPTVELCGGKPVNIPLLAPSYSIDWEEVKNRISRRTRMILINTPHNPTGTVMSEEDMLTLQKLVQDKDIVVLSDEVYEHIVFDGQEHQSVARYPKLATQSIIVGSFGKTFHATGWKTGFAIGPENLMVEFRKVHQFVTFAVNHPVQWALAEYMKDPESYLSVSSMYQQKRDFFLNAIKGSRFEVVPSAGTYFQLLSYRNISDEKDTDFAIRLTKEFKLASIPVSVFYHKPVQDQVLRFCFAKEESTLEKAAQVIQRI